MSNTKISYLSLIIVLIIPLLFSACKENELSELFVIKDTAEVCKVIISKGNKQLTVERDNIDSPWIVDKKYPADRIAVKKMMQALIGMKIDQTVPSNLVDSVYQVIKTKGRSVEILNKKNKILLAFLTAEYENTQPGTFMCEMQDQTPYIVNIPGLENNINNRFSLRYISWIEPLIFSYTPGEIKEIQLTNSSQPSQSFRLIINGSEAELIRIVDNSEVPSVNPRKVGNYLSYFMNVKFSDMDPANYTKIDSLLKLDPYSVITVKTVTDRVKSVKLYKIPDPDNPSGYNLNKLNALINDEDLVTLTWFDIDLLLKDIDYFIN